MSSLMGPGSKSRGNLVKEKSSLSKGGRKPGGTSRAAPKLSQSSRPGVSTRPRPGAKFGEKTTSMGLGDRTPLKLVEGSNVASKRPIEEPSSPTSEHSGNILETFGSASVSHHSLSASHSGAGRSRADVDIDALSDLDLGSMDVEGSVPVFSMWEQFERDKGAEVKPTKKIWTEEELDQPVHVELRETSTLTLLHIPSLAVWQEDASLSQSVAAKNARYLQMKEQRPAKDIYTSRAAQTFNNPTKEKEVFTSPPPSLDASAQATYWDIRDSWELEREKEREKEREMTSHLQALQAKQANAESKTAAPSTTSTGVGVGTDDPDDLELALSMAAPNQETSESMSAPVAGGRGGGSHAVLKSASLKRSLQVVEKAIIQNLMHRQHLLYRDHPVTQPTVMMNYQDEGENKEDLDLDGYDSEGERERNERNDRDEEGGGSAPTNAARAHHGGMRVTRRKPELLYLWSFGSVHTEQRNVTTLDWNRINGDMLVSGYGDFEFGNTRDGLICLWTLKNPSFPERQYHTKRGVTSLHFCDEHPHLLAAGMYDGSVSIYDIRETQQKPALESGFTSSKHSEAVMDLKWVSRGSERGSQLTSIGSDGSVKQWNTKKGLVAAEIMQLKRIPNQAQQQGAVKNSAVISRIASGLCFDFPFDDQTQYLVGTEDGIVHKCSVSYNDQFLDTFFGHTGPIYKIRCSPFFADCFLTCSADWSCRVWSQRRNKAVFTFQSGHDYVTDICWSPFNSTVFASVTRDARIEVWDLEDNTLDPYIRHQVEGKSLNCVVFGRNAPVLLTGGSDGKVDLYRYYGVEDRKSWEPYQQSKALEDALSAEAESILDKNS